MSDAEILDWIDREQCSVGHYRHDRQGRPCPPHFRLFHKSNTPIERKTIRELIRAAARPAEGGKEK